MGHRESMLRRFQAMPAFGAHRASRARAVINRESAALDDRQQDGAGAVSRGIGPTPGYRSLARDESGVPPRVVLVGVEGRRGHHAVGVDVRVDGVVTTRILERGHISLGDVDLEVILP